MRPRETIALITAPILIDQVITTIITINNAILIASTVMKAVENTKRRATPAVIRAVVARGRTDAVPGAMTRMTRAHVAIVAMGGLALILGTWLMGS